MSLTEQALYERTWGEFPELAKILDRKQLGPEWSGYTSVSDNVFDRVERLLKLFALIQENEPEVYDAVLRVDHPLRKELREASRSLKRISEGFAEFSKFTSDLADRG